MPDRNDFLRLETQSWIARWNAVVEQSRKLADDFAQLCDGQRLASAIEPLPEQS